MGSPLCLTLLFGVISGWSNGLREGGGELEVYI